MALIWIAVALVLAVSEVATVALFAAFLALGAFAAAIAAYLGGGIPLQVLVFGAVSMLGIIAVRPGLLSYLKRRSEPSMQSGAWGMVGQTGLVVDAIKGPDERGHVEIAGESWPALAVDGSAVAEGRRVLIVDIHRTTLLVDPRVRG